MIDEAVVSAELSDNYELALCKTCGQMTNHLKGVCQKCLDKIKEFSQNEDKLNKLPLSGLIKEMFKDFTENPLFRSGGFYPFKHDVMDFVKSAIEKAFRAGLNQGDWNAEKLEGAYEAGYAKGMEDESKNCPHEGMSQTAYEAGKAAGEQIGLAEAYKELKHD